MAVLLLLGADMGAPVLMGADLGASAVRNAKILAQLKSNLAHLHLDIFIWRSQDLDVLAILCKPAQKEITKSEKNPKKSEEMSES